MSAPVSPPAASAPMPRMFGRYQLFERVGAGGMAEIYLSRAHTELGGARLVVVKLILSALSHNEQFAEMLISEAKLAARLNHANVVHVFDLGRHEDVLFIAMEYVEGLDLSELLRRCAREKVPLPIEFSLFIVMEVLRGLSYAHRRTDDKGLPLGIVHRDVSPSNILISFEGEVKLCDFGIARANDLVDLVSEDLIRGKAAYMSPEQAWGKTLDARADVFAAGIVLWELLAGRRLYKPAAGASALELARNADIPPLPPRGLSDEPLLHDIVRGALAANRGERYPSAQAMLRDIEEFVARSRLIASPIRFGEWLRQNFGDTLIASRRARERAAKALESGPPALITPYKTPSPPPVYITDRQSDPFRPPPVAPASPDLPVSVPLALVHPEATPATPDATPAAPLPAEPAPAPYLPHLDAEPLPASAKTRPILYLAVGFALGVVIVMLVLVAVFWVR